MRDRKGARDQRDGRGILCNSPKRKGRGEEERERGYGYKLNWLFRCWLFRTALGWVFFSLCVVLGVEFQQKGLGGKERAGVAHASERGRVHVTCFLWVVKVV